MDINEKLDLILANQREILEQLEHLTEAQEQTREAITDFGLETSGYQTFTPDEG